MARRFLTIFACMLCMVGLSGCSGGASGSAIGTPTPGGGDDGGEGEGGEGEGGGGEGEGDGGGDEPTPLPPYSFADDEGDTGQFDLLTSEFTQLGQEIGGETPYTYSAAPGPASLAVTYGGVLSIFMTTSSDVVGASVYGVASLDVDTSRQTIDGSATNFMGKVPNPDGGQFLVDYNGIVALGIQAGGTQVGFADGVLIEIDGNLNNGVHDFVIKGSLAGNFRGSDGAFLYARGAQQIGDLTPIDQLEDGEIGVTIQTNRTSFANATLYVERGASSP